MPIDSAIAITIAGVDCYDEGTNEAFSDKDSSATRTILCAWSDRVTVINALIPHTTLAGILTLTVAGAPYPDAPFLEVETVEVEGVAGENGLTVGPNGMIAYDYARLTVTYRPRDINFDTVEVGSEAFDFASQAFTAPQDQSSFKWASDDEPIAPEASPPIPLTIVGITKTKNGLPDIPYALIVSFMDTVNSDAFLGFAAGQVKFDGASTVKRFTSSGIIRDVTYKFSARKPKWNHMFRPSTGVFEAFETITGGSFYGSADYNLAYT